MKRSHLLALALAATLLAGKARADDLAGGPPARPQTPRLFRPLAEIEAAAPRSGRRPRDQSEDLFEPLTDVPEGGFARSWPETTVQWTAANLYHQTRYFDEQMLERHGHSTAPRLQPLLSGAHFFGTFLLMPYKLGVDHPRDFLSTYGRGRPGLPAPCVRKQLPWEMEGAAYEMAGVAGLLFLLP